MRTLLAALATIFIIPLLFGGNNETASSEAFLEQMRALKKGELQKVEYTLADSIKSIVFLEEKIDERDASRNKSGYIRTDEFIALTPESVVDITDRYILLVVENRYGQLRAATFGLDGSPIESTLIYDNLFFMMWEFREYEARRYSPRKKFHFEIGSRDFIFSTIFKTTEVAQHEDLEWQIDWEGPDETNHLHRIRVNEYGRLGDHRYEEISSNSIVFEDFSIESSFYRDNEGKELKDESIRTVTDGIFHIYLDRDASMNVLGESYADADQVMRIMPREDSVKIQVFQRYSNMLMNNGDGDFCEIDSPTFESEWEELPMELNVFSLQRYTAEEQSQFMEITVNDFKEAVKAECGSYHYDLVRSVESQDDLKQHVGMKEITLKILCTNIQTGESSEEQLIFVIAHGC